MKKILSAILIVALTLSCAALLFSCNGDKEVKAPEGTVTRITLDVNPSIEFMVNDQDKVVSVTALNDDGAIIIAGEAFVGKTPEEATALFLKIAYDTGYIVEGQGELANNEIKFSVSGEGKYQEHLASNIKAEAALFIDTNAINAKINEAKALAKAELEAMVKAVSEKTAAELSALSENELYKMLEESRIETAKLLTEEMREAYNNAKNYEINFTKREEYSEIMSEIGGLYTIIQSSYSSALEQYKDVIDDIEEFRYNTLVSPESEYQKALLALREAKEKFLKERQYVLSLDINGEEYASAKLTLQASEEQFNAAEALVVSLGKAANASIDSLLEALASLETMLKNIEANFPQDLQAQLDAKATEIESELNAAKAEFFREFEEKHSADIAASLAALEAKKEELKANKLANE